MKLPVTRQSTTVEVSADSLALNTTLVTQATVLDGESLQDVPLNGRDFTQLLGTSASFAGYENQGSVNGRRSNQINYTINGTDNNDLYLNVDAVNQGVSTASPASSIPLTRFDEYSLQTTGNSESGSNQFRGDLDKKM